jgi:hypothetical protein
MFLRATDEGLLPGGGRELREAAKKVLGDALLQHLLAACADFLCPYCTDGFGACDSCGGTGRTEGQIACVPCRTLGVATCDFCAGSGVATYGFFPSGIQVAVAKARVDRAVRRLETIAAPSVSETRTAPGQSKRVIGRQYLQIYRLHAVFQNAFDLLSGGVVDDREDAAHLASRSWRGLARTEIAMARLLKMLAMQASAAEASGDGERIQYHQERARLLTELQEQLLDSADDRVRHLRDRQSQRQDAVG